jgi:hypothetical protein
MVRTMLPLLLRPEVSSSQYQQRVEGSRERYCPAIVIAQAVIMAGF